MSGAGKINNHSRAEKRLEKILSSINREGLDGVIIFSAGLSSILKPNYLQYFARFRPIGTKNVAVISKYGDVVLLIEPEWDVSRVSSRTWIRDVRGTRRFIDDMLKIIQEFSLKNGIGIIGYQEITDNVYSAIESLAVVNNADQIIEDIASEKEKYEIEKAREVGRVADIGFNALLKNTHQGIREYEIAAEIEFAMRDAGAEEIFLLLSSGKHNYEMHEPTDRRLKQGDIFIAEITPGIDGQFVQICRTIILGKARKEIAEKYSILVKAYDKGIKSVKIGRRAGEISKSINGVISEAGYRKYCYPPYIRTRGHGFGVGSVSPGSLIDDDTNEIIKKDQVIVIHPNQYFPETGYLACGKTVLIRNGEVEALSNSKEELYLKSDK